MAAIPRAGEGSGELAAFSGGLWAPRSSLLPVLSGLSGGEWSLARVCCARPPRNWGCSPACSGSRCDLPPCMPAGHELDAHSASAGGGVQYADSRALKGQTVPPQPLAASGGWRRGGSHFPGSWRVCVLPLVGASTPPVTQRTQWELARRDRGLWDPEPHLWPFLWPSGTRISCLIGARQAGPEACLVCGLLGTEPSRRRQVGGRGRGASLSLTQLPPSSGGAPKTWCLCPQLCERGGPDPLPLCREDSEHGGLFILISRRATW